MFGFKWLFKQWAAPRRSTLPVANRMTPPSPVPAGRNVPTPSNLKVNRQDRREQLYQVVREIMLRSEVLAASYKFKVLSLDTLGRQFLIMVDLLERLALPTDKFMEIESLIARTAGERHDLRVIAIYWRVNTPVTTVGRVQQAQHPPQPEVVRATAATPEIDHKARVATPPRSAASPVAPATVKRSPFEPISPDEVLAFKRALAPAAEGTAPRSLGQQITSGPRHPPESQGFADTLVLENDDNYPASPLSSTQYGDL